MLLFICNGGTNCSSAFECKRVVIICNNGFICITFQTKHAGNSSQLTDIVVNQLYRRQNKEFSFDFKKKLENTNRHEVT